MCAGYQLARIFGVLEENGLLEQLKKRKLVNDRHWKKR